MWLFIYHLHQACQLGIHFYYKISIHTRKKKKNEFYGSLNELNLVIVFSKNYSLKISGANWKFRKIIKGKLIVKKILILKRVRMAYNLIICGWTAFINVKFELSTFHSFGKNGCNRWTDGHTNNLILIPSLIFKFRTETSEK